MATNEGFIGSTKNESHDTPFFTGTIDSGGETVNKVILPKTFRMIGVSPDGNTLLGVANPKCRLNPIHVNDTGNPAFTSMSGGYQYYDFKNVVLTSPIPLGTPKLSAAGIGMVLKTTDNWNTNTITYIPSEGWCVVGMVCNNNGDVISTVEGIHGHYWPLLSLKRYVYQKYRVSTYFFTGGVWVAKARYVFRNTEVWDIDILSQLPMPKTAPVSYMSDLYNYGPNAGTYAVQFKLSNSSEYLDFKIAASTGSILNFALTNNTSENDETISNISDVIKPNNVENFYTLAYTDTNNSNFTVYDPTNAFGVFCTSTEYVGGLTGDFYIVLSQNTSNPSLGPNYRLQLTHNAVTKYVSIHEYNDKVSVVNMSADGRKCVLKITSRSGAVLEPIFLIIESDDANTIKQNIPSGNYTCKLLQFADKRNYFKGSHCTFASNLLFSEIDDSDSFVKDVNVDLKVINNNYHVSYQQHANQTTWPYSQYTAITNYATVTAETLRIKTNLMSTKYGITIL